MARIGCQVVLHHLLHKFGKVNPLALINSNFVVKGVKLKTSNETVVWYDRNYKASINIEYHGRPHLQIRIGCLKITIGSGHYKVVDYEMNYNNKAVCISFVNDITDRDPTECSVSIKIKSRDGMMRMVGELIVINNHYPDDLTWTLWHKIMLESNTPGDIVQILVSEIENISAFMIKVYEQCTDKLGRVCINGEIEDADINDYDLDR